MVNDVFYQSVLYFPILAPGGRSGYGAKHSKAQAGMVITRLDNSVDMIKELKNVRYVTAVTKTS